MIPDEHLAKIAARRVEGATLAQIMSEFNVRSHSHVCYYLRRAKERGFDIVPGIPKQKRCKEKHSFTDQQCVQLWELHKSGTLIEDLGKRNGMSKSAIYYFIDRGRKVKQRALIDELKAQPA